jgi:hypothetical protein
MPAITKSYLPALAGFIGEPSPLRSLLALSNLAIAFSFTYTTVVARKEGAAVDGARTRWQQQKARGDHAMYGANLLEQVQN